eukprot:Lithocolla_globosa_v1_NODE_136_length_5835_cov_11.826644.p7 type:complete len:113 gc:universal NODE_136_length_5835_cov_11.826644:3096-2758(-)
MEMQSPEYTKSECSDINSVMTSNPCHVSKILKKANSRLFLLYKMAKFLPAPVLTTFYGGAVRSPLEFAAPAFQFIVCQRHESNGKTTKKSSQNHFQGWRQPSSRSSVSTFLK